MHVHFICILKKVFIGHTCTGVMVNPTVYNVQCSYLSSSRVAIRSEWKVLAFLTECWFS